MRNIIINTAPTPFGLSPVACDRYAELTGREPNVRTIARDDPTLVQILEELGTLKASAFLTNLTAVSILSHANWVIEIEDGREKVILLEPLS
jgi:hypothetical protein